MTPVPARYSGGWLKVPYDGPELTVIEIGLADGSWHPAFRDWDDDGTRVVMIQADPGQAAGPVTVRAGGVVRGTHPGTGRTRRTPDGRSSVT